MHVHQHILLNQYQVRNNISKSKHATEISTLMYYFIILLTVLPLYQYLLSSYLSTRDEQKGKRGPETNL